MCTSSFGGQDLLNFIHAEETILVGYEQFVVRFNHLPRLCWATTLRGPLRKTGTVALSPDAREFWGDWGVC